MVISKIQVSDPGPSWPSCFPLFPVAYPFRIAMQLQYYVKREKCKLIDVIFPSGCKARAINLGNKSMKIGFFTGATSVRSKNIFTDISRYPTGKHEMMHSFTSKRILYLQEYMQPVGDLALPCNTFRMLVCMENLCHPEFLQAIVALRSYLY